MSKFKIGDLVVFLTETGLAAVVTQAWPEERCLNSISMVVEVESFSLTTKKSRQSQSLNEPASLTLYRLMMISDYEIRTIIMSDKDLALLAAA